MAERPNRVAMWVRHVWQLKIRNRHVKTSGIVHLGRRARVYCRRGLAHMEIGRGVWIGQGTTLRCHEGSLRIGDRVVFGGSDTVNCYLDVEVGDDVIFADWIYVTDFDHRYAKTDVRIQDQGIVTSPVRIEPDCWIGEKASVLRGSNIGRGSVIGAQTIVKADIPPYSVAVGSPARVVKQRGVKRG
jgi:acetyltransferase-like isoleucine patch superfamily enzyme